MKKPSQRKKVIVIVAIMAALLLFVPLGFIISRTLVPERSKESFCKILNENTDKLMSSNTSRQAKLDIYKRLERVAPSDMAEDMQRIAKGYQKIVDEPEDAMATEFGLIGEGRRLSNYAKKDCSEK